MKNYVSLKNNLEFKRVYDKKRTYSDMFMVIYISDNPLGYSRLGISVRKKVGNSIIRHRITRLIRSIGSSITALISWKIPVHLKDFGRWLRTSIRMSSWAKLCLSGTRVYRNLEHSRRFLYSEISIAVMYAMPKNVR